MALATIIEPTNTARKTKLAGPARSGVSYDRARMDKAISAQRHTMPQGLSREEIKQHLLR